MLGALGLVMIPMVWKVDMSFEKNGVVRRQDGSVFIDLIASAEFFGNCVGNFIRVWQEAFLSVF